MSAAVHGLIEHLRGTCLGEHEAVPLFYPTLTSLSDLPAADLVTLDQELILCEGCGWWFEPHEAGRDDNVCQDCDPEEDA